MNPAGISLREDAFRIWQAGVDAVKSERLMRAVMHRDGARLSICGDTFEISKLNQIAVVGAGKAGAGMAAGVEEALGEDLVSKQVSGWVNVPADCVRPLSKIQLHAARPAGVNEPTAEGVQGSEKILQIVAGLKEDDLCLVLLSGGGSALLPAPIPPLTLADKQAVTRALMNDGATIQELNVVRKRLSSIKGGKLAEACRAGRLIGLVISDVVGDPLDLIASGPTFPDPSTNADALAVLQQHGGPTAFPQRVLDYLAQDDPRPSSDTHPIAHVTNHIIGSNRTAIEAAKRQAESLGYQVLSLGSDNAGDANAEGQSLAERCRQFKNTATTPTCVLSGGEPVVHLTTTDRPRKGGRNQQLVLAAVERFLDTGMDGIAILSGGTDGEDGPTDAAGAVADAATIHEIVAQRLKPQSFLQINDAYTFFEKTGGLLLTGPTHTNVMDVRVAVVRP